jgi:hypothetical protein
MGYPSQKFRYGNRQSIWSTSIVIRPLARVTILAGGNFDMSGVKQEIIGPYDCNCSDRCRIVYEPHDQDSINVVEHPNCENRVRDRCQAFQSSGNRKRTELGSGSSGGSVRSDGCPIQARFWLEWGSSMAGGSLLSARSRFLAVHSDSISTRPSQPVA